MDEIRIIELKQSIFADNNADAELLRKKLKDEKTFLLNLMASPGAGKTTFLKKLIKELQGKIKLAVMEADIDSDVDARAINECGVDTIQLHTGGMCHLDADMTRQGLRELGSEKYELVISVLKGGAFVRYRVGDMYRCIGLENTGDDTKIPRFQYIDRIPTVIDIGGFTRVTEYSIQNAIDLSRLEIDEWIAMKEYNEENRPRLHLYVELSPKTLISQAVSKEILREHLSVYFKYVDQDYKDLKKILGVDPLNITILKCGTFAEYQKRSGKKLRKINPSKYDVMELLQTEESVDLWYQYRGGGRV